MSTKEKLNLVAILTIGFIAGIFVSEYKDTFNPQANIVLLDSSKVEICFTPPSGCGKVIANHIANAKQSIYIQAYGITSKEIVDEIIAADRRGVPIQILLDKSNLRDKYSQMSRLRDAGINVLIDKVSGIAHNKVMIIDGYKTITGSFNFTNSADKRNAENVIIIDDKTIASQYLQNWISRKNTNQVLE